MVLSVGGFHNCAVLDDDSFVCWGMGQYGQLGLGATSNVGDFSNEMGDDLVSTILSSTQAIVSLSSHQYHSCAILEEGGMPKCWGRNDDGQLGYGDTENRGDEANEMSDDLPFLNVNTSTFSFSWMVADIQYDSTFIVSTEGKLRGFGNNDEGQLGYGDTDNRGDEANEMSDYLRDIWLGTGRTVQQVCGGLGHTVL